MGASTLPDGSCSSSRDPVINLRVAKDVGEEEEEAYLRFTPVPAVPDPDTQEPRRPKESLDSFDLDLNLANRVRSQKGPVPS